MRLISTTLLALSPLALMSSPVAAQNTTTDSMATAQPVEDDDDFPWGLLGLLGLAGLLGRKRDDRRTDSTTR